MKKLIQLAIALLVIPASAWPDSDDPVTFEMVVSGGFVIQVPGAPFGVSSYLGSIPTNHLGQGSQTFIGRFSSETFTVAPGSAPAPLVHHGPFPDATLNPPFNPIHQYHLGLWFGSPEVAVAAHCPPPTTPFSGEHNGGIQVLNTRNFPDDHGPLRQVTSSP